MAPEKLIATGLTAPQAEAYALLLQTGGVTPPQAAQNLKITRTNAYKLLDKLVELGLAIKDESTKKATYQPGNPMALGNLVADQRNLAAAREDAVKAVLKDLLATYHTHTEQPSIQVVTGRQAVADAYRRQINQLQSIYFIRSRADIPVMGFETLHDIRITPGRHGVKRYGITPDLSTGTASNKGDKRSNMDRTWVRQEDYNAPVEWSASGDTLLIIVFGVEPHAITITNPMVADAFRQLWQLLNTCLQAMPYYKDLPRH
ncbi:MAG TPA: helix-turn-helix domain-containing protein [Verrucomicrobiae bacterium]|nr:helix-turn-helix domain-containing protein [Verrucomicrobiae bacterium]